MTIRLSYRDGNLRLPYLKTVRNAIRPLVISLEHTLDHANSDQLSDSPARIAPSSEVPSESYGTDFTGVRDSDYIFCQLLLSFCS